MSRRRVASRRSDGGMCTRWTKVRVVRLVFISPLCARKRADMRCTEAVRVDNAERLKRLILSADRNTLGESPSESRRGSESDATGGCARTRYTRPRNFIRDLSADDFYEARGGFYEKRGR